MHLSDINFELNPHIKKKGKTTYRRSSFGYESAQIGVRSSCSYSIDINTVISKVESADV